VFDNPVPEAAATHCRAQRTWLTPASPRGASRNLSNTQRNPGLDQSIGHPAAEVAESSTSASEERGVGEPLPCAGWPHMADAVIEAETPTNNKLVTL
jgi:hypothetical protein